LAWGLFVAIHGLTPTERTLPIRCPRCGWRFGFADKCSSCGFPRRSVSCQSNGQLS
jgi:ribosomal protein L37E